MRTYAEGTSVSVEKTRAELDRLLAQHGATSRGIAQDDQGGRAIVGFALKGERFRLTVPLPKLGAFGPEGASEPRGWGDWQENRRSDHRIRAFEQACRERWRGVLLLVKSKLEIIRLGMSTARQEFLAQWLLPNGKTVGEMIDEEGPRLLGAGSPR